MGSTRFLVGENTNKGGTRFLVGENTNKGGARFLVGENSDKGGATVPFPDTVSVSPDEVRFRRGEMAAGVVETPQSAFGRRGVGT